jgi:uncharacterized membrane protein required for colicin V production
MVIILLALALIAAITFFQVVNGLFSALIMTVLTVLCAALACCYYEPLAEATLGGTAQAPYAKGAALLALFVIPLLALRIVLDRVQRRNLVLGMWADRIGGGALGLITAMILVGILTIVLQLLPFGESIMGYRSHGPDLRRHHRLAPLYPDEFTLGMFNLLSRTSLGVGKPFSEVHNDLLLESFCMRNSAGKNGTRLAPADCLKIRGIFEPKRDEIPAEISIPPNPLLPEGEFQKLIIARVAVQDTATDKDNWWRLPATQFRLEAKSKRGYYPVGYLTGWERPFIAGRRRMRIPPERSAWVCHGPEEDEEGQLRFDQLYVERESVTGRKELIVDWVYRLREDDEPETMTFRGVVELGISKISKQWPDLEEKPAAMDRIERRPRR